MRCWRARNEVRGRSMQASAAGAPARLGRVSGQCQHYMLQLKAKRSVLNTEVATPRPAARGPASEGNVVSRVKQKSRAII